LANIGKVIKPTDPEDAFFFLKLFTASDGTLYPFFVFIGFLGPLLGISLGFDAINTEHNRGTLSRVLAQPVHRDYLINAKFVAALTVISVMFFTLGFLVVGRGLITIGIPPTAEEFLRIVFFILLSICYVAFWLNLAILFSVQFRQAATSALACIAVWLFFSIFYGMIVDLIGKIIAPPELLAMASEYKQVAFQNFIFNLMRVSPSQLFMDASNALLMPNMRILGAFTMEQAQGAIPSPLPLGQSLLIVWSQLTALIAGTVTWFGLSYLSFMRREIRSR
jgi:ABC-2 type transport system permease protein